LNFGLVLLLREEGIKVLLEKFKVKVYTEFILHGLPITRVIFRLSTGTKF
jgi:hypothetical protein